MSLWAGGLAAPYPDGAPLTPKMIEALARRFPPPAVQPPSPDAPPELIPVAAAVIPRASEMAYPQIVIEEAERRVSDGSWRASLQAMAPAAVEREIASELALNNYLQIRNMRLDSRGLPPREVKASDSPIVDDASCWTGQSRPSSRHTMLITTTIRPAGYGVPAVHGQGWNTWAASFIDSGNLAELKRARLLCHAQAQRAAMINQISSVQGALAYQVQVPIVQTCENVNQARTNELMVTALVIRTNSDEHPDGLAIDQLWHRRTADPSAAGAKAHVPVAGGRPHLPSQACSLTDLGRVANPAHAVGRPRPSRLTLL